jgi:two-component system chemotaxis sensor kinase CheA
MVDENEIDRGALLEAFVVEAHEGLDAMEEALLRLDLNPDDEETLASLFRGAHTLKGNSSCVGLDMITNAAHSFEEVLDRLRAGELHIDSALVSAMLAGVDGLRRLVIAGDDATFDDDRPIRMLLARVAAGVEEDVAVKRGEISIAERNASRRSSLTLRIDVAKLDRMLDVIGELTVRRSQWSAAAPGGASSPAGATEGGSAPVSDDLDALFADLRELVTRARMVPVGPLFRSYLRLVRDTARALGKEARLVIEGEELEADTAIVEQLRDPLTHMIRNALDHGIEQPDVRVAGGKPREGTITLRATRRGGGLEVQLEDDGAGMSRTRIIQRAREMGIAPGDADRQPDNAIFELIFHPGFSTAASVTDVSGRGVGMDVVRRHIAALRGSIAVASREKRGTTINLRLPLTVAIINGFKVGVGGQAYVIPLESVAECLEAGDSDRSRANGVFNLRGEPLPYVRLRKLFGSPSAEYSREALVVVRDGDTRAALAVDALYGETQCVIKPLGPHFRGTRAFAGSALADDGRVALVLDVPGLLQTVQRQQVNG